MEAEEPKQNNERSIISCKQFKHKEASSDNRELWIWRRGRHFILIFLDYSLRIDIPESVLVLFSPKNLVRLLPLKEVKPSPDR